LANKDNVESVSQEELYDMLEFARQAYSGTYPHVFTPELINSRMKDINLNPLEATQKSVEKALADPKNHENELIGFSEFFELSSMIYKRMLLYMSHLLAFAIKDIVCVNADEKDYTTMKYKKDYQVVCDFLDSFNIKQEFSKVMRQLLRKDASFWVLRDEGQKYILQELPERYCMITGKWDYGLLFDFNMYWFMQSGVDINMYPDIFKQKFNDTFYNSTTGQYNPSADINHRTGEYVMWTQTSPEDNFWAWKMTPESITKVPFLAPLFQDVVLQPFIRNLQTNKYIVEATKVMVGLIPMMKDPKGANVKDMIAISAETAGKFLNLLQKGISDVIKAGAVPFQDVKTLDFEGGQRNMLEDYTKTTTAMSGVNARLIYSSDKQNIMETELSLDVDVMTLGYMYSYFEDFLNYMINKRTKNYKFRVFLGGINTTTDVKNRRKEFSELAAMGVVLPDRLAFSLDMYPHHLEKQMEKAKATKFADKLIPMLNMYTENGQQKPGAPTKEVTDLSESGEQTRSDNMK
jgi:hypothetical protein